MLTAYAIACPGVGTITITARLDIALDRASDIAAAENVPVYVRSFRTGYTYTVDEYGTVSDTPPCPR